MEAFFILQVYVCVGSSCHLKGAQYVINEFKRLIAEKKIESEVELKASFCLGKCTEGISAKVNDDFIPNLGVNNVEKIFEEYIYRRLKK